MDERHRQELAQVAARYARRTGTDRYSLLRPDVWQLVQERQRCGSWASSSRAWIACRPLRRSMAAQAPAPARAASRSSTCSRV